MRIRASRCLAAVLALGGAESLQALGDDLFRFTHDAVHQFLTGRNVMDQAGDHAAAPAARIHVAILHDLGIDARDFLGDVGEGQLITKLLLLRIRQ